MRSVSMAPVSIAAPTSGLIEATIRYALDHEKLSDAAQQLMQNALNELGVIETRMTCAGVRRPS